MPDKIKGEEYVYYLDGIQGDGTVNSTLDDLLIWNNAILEQYLVDEKYLDLMFEPTVNNDGQVFPYGLGWELDEKRMVKNRYIIQVAGLDILPIIHYI